MQTFYLLNQPNHLQKDSHRGKLPVESIYSQGWESLPQNSTALTEMNRPGQVFQFRKQYSLKGRNFASEQKISSLLAVSNLWVNCFSSLTLCCLTTKWRQAAWTWWKGCKMAKQMGLTEKKQVRTTVTVPFSFLPDSQSPMSGVPMHAYLPIHKLGWLLYPPAMLQLLILSPLAQTPCPVF